MKPISKILYIAAGILLIAVAVGLFSRSDAKVAASEHRSEADIERSIEAVDAYISNTGSEDYYYSVYNSWKKTNVPVPTQHYSIPAAKLSGGTHYGKAESEGYDGDVVNLAPKDVVTFDVDVAKQGLYEIWLDHYVLPQTVLKPELSIDINGKEQYNEMNKLYLEIDWRPNDERKTDQFGDELSPKSEIVSSWKNEALADPNYFFTEPLKFQLNKGKNTIRMTLNEGYILIGKIELKNSDSSNVAYEKYLASMKGTKEAANRLVTIEAENISLKNRQSIRSKYVRDPQITPYSYKHRVLNVLDGDSFGDSGDKVSYRFTIEESGFYNLTFKYSQNTNSGMPTHRKIEIDGKVPFKELENYSFGYSSDWRNETLHDKNGKPYRIYLEKGEHTLTLSIDNANVKDIYQELVQTLEAIDATAQEINRLTGGLVDKKREWKIEKYFPDITTYLVGIEGKIEQQKLALIGLTGNKDLPVITELSIAENLVREFIQNPEELPHYMNNFNEGQSSAYGRIQTILPMLLSYPMNLDKIYVHTDGEELPAANASLLTRAVENTKAFLYSFVDDRYASAAGKDDNVVQIWVNQSRLYVENMQQMIDEEFTPATGIKVKLSLLPDENKIVLANAAGSTPDAALGVGQSRPYELALRGIIENLRTYDGFYKLAEQYDPSAFIPYIYDKGVYAFPETQDVKLLFYRKDIMKLLGQEPPQTWDDVVGLVPVLQRYNMNFYTPLGSDNSYKGFDVTTPFIYQFGGQLYDSSGSKTVINKGGAYRAFEFMTDLFTVYNTPATTSNFFQSFRNGKTPVGIGDANMYIQLKYAAPELAGQWGILPIPGVKDEKGTIERWDPTYGSSSIIFKGSDKKQEAWEFIKWWASAKTQSEFSYNLQSTLGDEFLYMTANLEGFKQSAWPSDSKDVILDQWKWIQATGRVPGDYVLEREISNAWNQVVLSRQNPRIAIDNAVKTTNRELERKLTEFGYIKEGTLINPYVVPTIKNVKNWVRINGN